MKDEIRLIVTITLFAIIMLFAQEAMAVGIDYCEVISIDSGGLVQLCYYTDGTSEYVYS